MHIVPVVEEDTWISGFDIARDSDTRRVCGTTGRVDNGLGTSERQLVDVKGCVICEYVPDIPLRTAFCFLQPQLILAKEIKNECVSEYIQLVVELDFRRE